MFSTSGTGSNPWRKRTSGLYYPDPGRTRFSLDNLIFCAQFWHPESNGSTFTTKFPTSVVCTVDGATWGYQGFSFATNDKITVTVPTMPTGAADLSVEMWIYSAFYVASAALFDYGTAANYQSFRVVTSQAATASAYIATYNQNSDAVTIANSAWVHLVATLEDGEDWALYVNGALSDSGTFANTCNLTSAAGAISIGCTLAGAGFNTATIGELRIYTKTLPLATVVGNRLGTKWRYS